MYSKQGRRNKPVYAIQVFINETHATQPEKAGQGNDDGSLW